MKKKRFLKSKANWFNILSGALVIGGEYTQIFPAKEHTAEIAGWLTIGNIILRTFFTSGKIGAKA